MSAKSTAFPLEGISVPNAGLVILNNYFSMLFERLELVKNDAFISDNAQLDSIHYLQYIASGVSQTEESLLTLNAILVGLSPTIPLKSSIDISEDQKQLIDGMIQSAMNYWKAIGHSSIDGFRGNWLIREGILHETEKHWQLIVEKRPYDILLVQSPFSFSTIKLPWMEKPLQVIWSF